MQITAAVVCVTILDRLKGDQVDNSKVHEIERRSYLLVIRHIVNELKAVQ